MCAPSVLYAAGLNARSDDGGIVALTTVATFFKMVQEFKSSEVRIPEPQLHDAAKIVTSRLGHDRFRVAETAAFNGYNLDIRADRIQPLVRWCQKSFPHMSTATVIPWAGLRPMTPSMPRVVPGKRLGIYYNRGHVHLGWTLSAATRPSSRGQSIQGDVARLREFGHRSPLQCEGHEIGFTFCSTGC
jgi:glycine/D-amino acid oxidase-like deaminating enzyme